MQNNTDNKKWMFRCLELASKGKLGVKGNPMVGSVIIHNNKIIGEGYHAKFGKEHAEVNAINSVKNKELLKESTLFVSLEPCAHYGKTPPCSDLIIRSGIPKVVIATIDPFSEVSGAGIERLKNNGIEVVIGVLQEEARFLNRNFFVFHKEKRPYVILKWAESKDGFIDIIRSDNQKGSYPISQPESKIYNHQWRAEEDAIFVGYKTIVTDNPSLNCRVVFGDNPLKITADFKNGFKDKQADFNFFKDTNFLSFNSKDNFLKEFKENLYSKNIQSIIIEGGAKTHQFFVDNNLWDEIRVIKSKIELQKGIKNIQVKNKDIRYSLSVLEDTITCYTNPNLNL